MAMEQRRTRIVGDEIDLRGAETSHVDGVLHHAGGRLVTYLGHLERMPVQVNRMIVTAPIGHGEAITLSRLDIEQPAGVRPGLAIERPAIVAAAAARHLLEQELETFVRGGHGSLRAEDGVVPGRIGRRRPLRLPVLVGVFDDDAEALIAVLVVDGTENPYTGPLHFHDRIDALRRGEEQRVDAALRWHRIPIEGDHGETMPWKRERYVLGRTGIEQPKQRALAFTYADRLAVSEHPVVERSRCVQHLEAVVRRRSLADVLHAHPPRLPVMGGKQDLLVVTAGIIRRLDNEKTKKARIETAREIRPGRVVAVVPPRPGWLRGECVALRRAVLHDR